jgi:hypothetical protein
VDVPVIQPVKSDDSQPTMDPATGDATLGVGDYYYYFGIMAEREVGGFQVKWDATAVGTVTFEDCLWSEDSAALTSTNDGDWIPEDPPDAYVAVVGGSAVGLVVTIPGGSAGGCSAHLGDFGLTRGRVHVSLSTGGVLRCGVSGKR